MLRGILEPPFEVAERPVERYKHSFWYKQALEWKLEQENTVADRLKCGEIKCLQSA